MPAPDRDGHRSDSPASRPGPVMSSGMEPGVNLAEPAEFHPGVDLGRRDRRVPQHLLDSAKVRAPGQQVGGEAVPQGVRTDVSLQSGRQGVLLDDPSRDRCAKAAGPTSRPEPWSSPDAGQTRTGRSRRGRPTGRSIAREPSGTQPLLVTLADAPGQALLEVEVRRGEGPTTSEARQPVAYSVSRAARSRRPRRVSAFGVLQQPIHRRRAQDRGQAIPDRRRDQQLGQVVGELSLEDQEPEERREAREVPADAARCQARSAELLHVSAQRWDVEPGQRARERGLAPAEKSHQVGAIRRQRVRRDAALRHQVMQERPDRVAIRFGPIVGHLIMSRMPSRDSA